MKSVQSVQKILITGASSRSGKTTVTCGLLAALKRRGLRVIAYKAGPDYIDTEYLRCSGSCEAFNLDTWLMTESRMRELFAQTSQGHDIAVIEGTMGLFDGSENGTAAIAKLLDAPVVLVLNVRSMAESAAALAIGFREYDPDVKLAGVILNFTGSSYHEQIISSALNEKGIKVFGALRRDEALKIPERHLGLVQAVENENFDFERLRAKFESSVKIDELLRISIVNSSQTIVNSQTQSTRQKFPVRIAVAKDEAFTFRYAESERMFENLGAEIVKFSPLHDEKLPAADGYIFGGGYPEIFASELSRNAAMLASVKKCSRPIFAECGGMMYLCRNLNGVTMAGLLPFEACMSDHAVMGYRTAESLSDNLLCRKGEKVRGHEYHYGRISAWPGDSLAFAMTRKNGDDAGLSGYSKGCLLASWLHVNFYGEPEIAEHFVKVCHNYHKNILAV